MGSGSHVCTCHRESAVYIDGHIVLLNVFVESEIVDGDARVESDDPRVGRCDIVPLQGLPLLLEVFACRACSADACV